MRFRVFVSLTLLILLTACGGETAPSAAPQGSLTLLLDGQEVAVLQAAALRPRILLHKAAGSALPLPADWRVLEARGKARVLRVLDPSTRYKEQDVCLYLGADGRPAVGIFRRDRPELTEQTRRLIQEPTLALVAADSVHIRTEAEPAADMVAPSLTIVSSGEEPRSLGADKIRGLEEMDLAHVPGREQGNEPRNRASKRRKKGGGYHLADVLALIEERPIASVRLVARDGTEVVLDAMALQARSGTQPLLKLNRRGQFHFRPTGGDGSAAQLRDIERVWITLEEK